MKNHVLLKGIKMSKCCKNFTNKQVSLHLLFIKVYSFEKISGKLFREVSIRILLECSRKVIIYFIKLIKINKILILITKIIL